MLEEVFHFSFQMLSSWISSVQSWQVTDFRIVITSSNTERNTKTSNRQAISSHMKMAWQGSTPARSNHFWPLLLNNWICNSRITLDYDFVSFWPRKEQIFPKYELWMKLSSQLHESEFSRWIFPILILMNVELRVWIYLWFGWLTVPVFYFIDRRG